MPAKKKVNLEYEVHSSPKILYSYLKEPNALAQWFADEVNIKEHVYTFRWEHEEARARIVADKENKLIRFKWIDDDQDYYTEFEIVQDELTNDIALSVTEFTDETPAEHKLIWDTQVRYLLGAIGA